MPTVSQTVRSFIRETERVVSEPLVRDTRTVMQGA
jgi:hypothetical protein